MFDDLIPLNTKGKPSDLEFSITLPSRDAACDCFNRAAKRLCNPSSWHELAGWGTAYFILIGQDGTRVERLAEKGDYLRIDIPGPGPTAGDGYDWVRIEMMEYHADLQAEEEWMGMRVRPSPGPASAAMEPAHFFRSDATSSFIINRTGQKVTAYYHGRNEIPNTVTEKISDNIRNAIVATGAILSLSELQWSALSKGFLS